MQFTLNVGVDPGKVAVRMPDGSLELIDITTSNHNETAKWWRKVVQMQIDQEKANAKAIEDSIK